MPTPIITTRGHCNACGGERNHFVLHSERTEWSTDDGVYGGSDTYETLRCAGCDAIKLRHTAASFDENTEDRVTYFPASVFRQQPRWFLDFDLGSFLDESEKLPELLNEIYVALQHGLLRLAAMGVRSLLERMMIAKVGDRGTFKENVDEFERQGYLSKVERTRLEAVLEAGHAAIHRAYDPTREDIIVLLDITEHLIESIFIHGDRVTGLGTRVPGRKPRGAA